VEKSLRLREKEEKLLEAGQGEEGESRRKKLEKEMEAKEEAEARAIRHSQSKMIIERARMGERQLVERVAQTGYKVYKIETQEEQKQGGNS
jgi:hypothetical protein